MRGRVGLELSRRDFLRDTSVLGAAALIASAVPVAERILAADPALAAVPTDEATMQAFADTIIPGRKAATTDLGDEIQTRLADLAGWSHQGDALVKTFQFEGFEASVDFVVRITPPAEEMNHHPDLAISWNKVNVSLSTHSEGGITENDFKLATKIDSLA